MSSLNAKLMTIAFQGPYGQGQNPNMPIYIKQNHTGLA